VLSWDQLVLNPQGSLWTRIQGERQRAPSFASKFDESVARRMWRRSIWRRWNEGTLDFSERYERLDALPWIAIAFAVIWCWGPFSRPQFASLWQQGASGGAAWLNAAIYAASIVVIPAIAVGAALCLAESRVRASRITSEFVEVTMPRGRVLKQRWTDLRDVRSVRCCMQARFTDGTVLKFPGGKYAILILLRRMAREPRPRRKSPAEAAVVRHFVGVSLSLSAILLAPPVLLMASGQHTFQAVKALLFTALFPLLLAPVILVTTYVKLRKRAVLRVKERRAAAATRVSQPESGTNPVPPRITQT
jgi:hypothetical protein